MKMMGGLGIDEINPFLFDKDEYERVVEKLESKGVRFLEDYAILDEINGGSFGVVYRAHDKRHNEAVAMKKDRHGLNSPSVLTEIKILKSLPPHPNIVQFKGLVVQSRHMFVSMELMDYDLKALRGAKGGAFTLLEIKFIIREILKGVRFLHENSVMHRDLKPGNILLSKEKNSVKICDFGLSAPTGADSRGVGTRFYKAPEVLSCSSKRYTSAIDLWSVGCIMAELALDEILFRGRSDADQLGCIRRLLCGKYCNDLKLWMASNAAFSSATDLTPAGLQLLERLLAYDPSKRISAADALDHPWFKQDPILPF